MPTIAMLLAALFGLFAGPLLLLLWPSGRGWRGWLDGLSMSLVGGFCLLHLLPHAILHGGLMALVVAVVAWIVPAALHRLGGKASRTWTLALFGIFLLHAVTDGVALSLLEHGGRSIGIAVAAHRLPVGLAVFVSGRILMRGGGWIGLGLLCMATLLGFWVGDGLPLHDHHWLEGALEAAVAGVLLHIIVDHHSLDEHTDPHDHDLQHDHDHEEDDASSLWSALGVLLGLLIVGLTTAGSMDAHGLSHISELLDSFLTLALRGAPALLMGYLLSGMVIAVLRPAGPDWLRGGGALRQVGRGLVFGLPRPLRSCDVLPLYASLTRQGAPATAALAFVVATPALGLDGLLLSIPMLGASLTLARVIGAVAMALLVALLLGRVLPTSDVAEPVEPVEPTPAALPALARLRAGLRHGMMDLVDHTIPWVGMGLLLAAMVEPLMGHTLLSAMPPAAQVPLLAALGVPGYISAAGATPLAAVAIHKGFSAGAVLAFLLAGSGTNLATLGLLSILHSREAAIGFGTLVLMLAMLTGWIVDAVGVGAAEVLPHTQTAEPGLVAVLCLMVLLGLAVGSLLRQGPRGMIGQIVAPVDRSRTL